MLFSHIEIIRYFWHWQIQWFLEAKTEISYKYDKIRKFQQFHSFIDLSVLCKQISNKHLTKWLLLFDKFWITYWYLYSKWLCMKNKNNQNVLNVTEWCHLFVANSFIQSAAIRVLLFTFSFCFLKVIFVQK